jgi:phage terminase small subunit
MAELTPKQRLFVAEYLKDLNATQAAIRAGYSERTAKQQGQRLLTNVDVAKAVTDAQAERVERIKIDADWVLKSAVDLHRRCLAEQVFRDGVPLKDEDGNPITRVNAAGAARAIELVGKHVGIQAFQEKAVVDINHNYGDMTLEEINAKIAAKLAAVAVKPKQVTAH